MGSNTSLVMACGERKKHDIVNAGWSRTVGISSSCRFFVGVLESLCHSCLPPPCVRDTEVPWELLVLSASCRRHVRVCCVLG